MKCPNCGNELIKGALFCASCGNKIPEELLNAATEAKEPEAPQATEETVILENPAEQKIEPEVSASAPTGTVQPQQPSQATTEVPTGASVIPDLGTGESKKKKMVTRVIGVAAVVVVVAAVGFGGFKAWNAMNPQLDKQLLYSKNDGRLYFTANVGKEKDPVEIYRSHGDNASYDIKYSKNQKYAFFLTNYDDKQRLYRVNTQKLTSNETKNEKYIEEIDSNVTDYAVIGDGKALYYRDSNSGSGKELNYYDGKDTKEIDSDVSRQFHKGDTVYYLRDSNDEYNYDLCYYNLSSGKHGDMDECYNVADYNENEILYSVSDGDTCDIYKAKPGSKGTKLVSEVATSWDGNLDAGTICYLKERSESKTYYDFVNDPYAADDASVSEPYEDDYYTEVDDPEDILYSSDYGDYIDDRDYFYSYDVSNYSRYVMGDNMYEYYGVDGNTYYYYNPTGTFYYYDSEAYSDAWDKYYESSNRNELREELKDNTYDVTSYDIYLYSAKGGEKKIAESVDVYDADYANNIFLYRKIEDLGDAKVCSIDEIEYASDVADKLYDEKSDTSIYANVNGKEQDMKMTYASLDVSEDGKTVMIVDRSSDSGRELIAYTKKGDGLSKIGTVEKDYASGSWYGDDYYYFDTDYNFCVYSNGKSKKIAKDVAVAELEEDGNFMTFERSDSSSTDVKIVKGDEQIGKIRDVNYSDTTYIDSKCIVYLTNDDDLYVYDGEDSRKIDRDVYNYWMESNSKSAFSSWY